MALLTLIVLGIVGGAVLWWLRENRHRWPETEAPDPGREDDEQ